MQQPLVSVIVPIYGVEKYIERCARSIFEQTYQNIEIIFVNDCTPDKSMDILNKVMQEYPNIQSKIQIINHEINRGVAITRRDGMIAAKGKYVIQWDSDDYVDVQFLEKMVALAEKEDADITICDMNKVYKGKTIHIHINPSLDNIECMKQVLVGKMHSSLCNKLIRRSLYVENNIYPTEGLNMREDLSVMYRLLYFATKIAYLPEALYNYILVRDGSYTSQKMTISHQKNAYELIEQMKYFVDSNNCKNDIIYAVDLFIASIYSSIALYGDIHDLKNNSDLFRSVSLSTIRKSNASKLIKITGLLLFCKLYFSVKLMRFLQQLKHKI
jgi:glycosyltransferase involved in cell wall biosynthesis